MPVDRKLWNQPLTRTEAPLWPCATCRAGLITLEKDSLVAEQTAVSQQASREEWWDPDMYRGRFIAALRCGNRKCKDLTTVAGDVVVEEDYDVEQQQVWREEQLLPRFFSPGPNLINLPADVPEEVAEDIRVACQIVWAEPAAAGNRIRTAVERLLDNRGMRRKRRTTKGNTSS